ncbi:DNA ligase 4 [Exidia glandulosa HHB12029]|uniref:DNA ligase n=1 Tax=Exidia glandulosa HHB12029 TaxID=1314781 RepID=A0A165MZG7_EXIGL|nr:DNA ligase 4 [Exidia glandulosa HHB12029]
MPLPTPAPSSPGGGQNDLHVEQNDEDDVFIQVPENTGTYPDFGALCALLERLAKERKQDMRRKLLERWFNVWRERVGMDLYPLLRLLLPQKDRERAVYGLKEKALGKAFIKALGLNPHASDAVRLINWKRPSDKDKAAGDFPTVLQEVVQKRSSVMRGTMRVDQVNECLDDLAACSGKLDKIMHVIRRISDSTTPSQQAWIVRIILKDLVISVKETTILSVFHPDALSLFNTCSDLKRVAHQLWDPTHRLHDKDKSVQLFRCFAPMLCKRPTKSLEDTVALMKEAKFVIEEKLDGERIQVHKRGNEYRYYSRKGKDYTYLYGQTKTSPDGSLTPYLDKAINTNVQDCILDGEMLVWDPVTEKLMPFGHLKTAALDRTKAERKARPCLKIFDVLYVNGTSLIDKKLSARKQVAHSIIKEIRGRVEFSYEQSGSTAKEIRDALEKVMEDRGEGLVVKHPDSQYQLNGRVSDWIKVKPEYMDDMGETVDVLVVGGNYGSGRRGGGVSTFICAVIEDRQETEDEDPKYSTFVRIGSGFSYLDYEEIRKKNWKKWDPKKPPAWLITAPTGDDDKGDLYIEPQDSFIVKVKAAEITKSEGYGMKFTMRFPRAMRIRDDLDISDCLTASDLLNMTAAVRKRKADDDVQGPKKKRKTTAKTSKSLAAKFQSIDSTQVEVTSDIFAGMKFNVLPHPRIVGEKAKLETLIKQHGGTFCQRPQAKEISTVYRVFGGSDQTPPHSVVQIIRQEESDILRPSFIHDSIENNERQPLRKKYFFHRAADKDRTEEEDDEYEQGDPEDEEADIKQEDNDMDTSLDGPLASSSKAGKDAEMHKSVQPELGADSLSSEYSEWMVLPDQGQENSAQAKDDGDESETQDEWESGAEDGADKTDEWEMVSNGTLASSVANASTTLDVDGSQVVPNAPDAEPPTQLKMGQDDDAAEYDPDIIFKHLAFYLDTPTNARANGMDVKTKHEEDIEASMAEIKKLIEENGGKILELSDPRLTHVVLDQRDYSRLKDLRNRTKLPKRRQLVQSDFVRAAVDAQTLPDEDGFRP